MIRRLCALLASLALASCAAEPAPPMALKPEIVRSAQRFTREYVLQPGDQLALTVFHVPELTSVVIVRPDGYVSLPILKDVKVEGMTVTEVDKELERRYATRLVDPNVTINVQNPRQASVYVLGDVTRPGPVPIRDAHTVADALANAGGPLRSGSMDNVAVVRLDEDGYLTGTIIPRAKYGETAFYMALAAVPLKTGDMVIVPESGRSQFVRFISDFVNTPLTGVSQILQPYFQFETLKLYENLVK